MTVTVMHGDGPAVLADARPDGDRLWLSPVDLPTVTGWELKPEGLCREHACVPLPADGSWTDDSGWVDVAAFAARFGRPAVRDDEHAIWAFGESAGRRSDQLRSLRAPDFTLPD